MQPVKPKWRNGVGMALILFIIAAWSVAVVSLAPWISQFHILIQTLFYGVAGICWVFPVRPLLTWMELGGEKTGRD